MSGAPGVNTLGATPGAVTAAPRHFLDNQIILQTRPKRPGHRWAGHLVVNDIVDTASAEYDQVVLGRALRDLRHRAGLTQEQLAAHLGVDATFVGRLERGKRGARWHTVRRVVRALGATTRQFADAIDRQDSSPSR